MRFDHSGAVGRHHDDVRLESNLIFPQVATELSALGLDSTNVGCRPRLPLNLIANDGANRLYAWNSREKKLQYVEVHNSDSLSVPPDQRCLVAPKPPKTVQLSSQVNFPVHFLSFNRVGRSLALAGSGGILVVDLLPQVSAQYEHTAAAGVCRASPIGVESIFQARNVHSIRILQVSWHPYSDTHIGVLSSDGIFRLFDLSLDKERAEQEYHLQVSSSWRPGFPFGRPVSFSFGGDHLWDRFTVFVVFSDGFVYALSPVIPFGSLYSSVAVEELAKDAGKWSTLLDTTAAQNASLALAWLDSVFPGLPANPGTGAEVSVGTFLRKACAHVPVDASVALQGPLKTVWSGDVLSMNSGHLDVTNHACDLAYNTIGKDTILAVAGLEGQIHLYALADEVQPMWNPGIVPRLIVDDDGHLLSVGMMVEVSKNNDMHLFDKPISLGNGEEVSSTVWSGQPPPLLQLSVVDLALSPTVLEAAPTFLLVDPAVPERLFCYHGGGVDAILLQWLPFSDQSRNGTSSTIPPAVFPVLDTYSAENCAPLPLLGVVAYLDSFGETWVVSVTLGGTCVVVEMKANRVTAMCVEGPTQDDKEIETEGAFPMLSKELLQGPKDIPIAQVAASGLRLTLNSIEGRTILHDQCKLLHEKYIEYAHRVYVELTSHGSRLRDIIGHQHDQLLKVQYAFNIGNKTFDSFALRIQQACRKNKELEARIKTCRLLPALQRRPLTIAERDLKDLLDRMMLEDLDVLKSAVEVLKVRSEHHAARFNLHGESSPQDGRVVVPDSQMRRLKLAVDQLSHIVEDATKKVQVVDESVRHREILKDR